MEPQTTASTTETTKPIATLREGRESADQDAYVLRMTPAWCLPDSPMPETWTGSSSEWDALAEEARAFLQAKARIEFTAKIAEQGYYADELGSGELRPGAEIMVLTGEVKRPPTPNLPAETRAACQRVLEEAARLHVPLNGLIELALEQAGQYGAGVEKDVQRKLAVAISDVEAHRAQLEVEHREAVARPVLTVRTPFRAVGGKQYEAGSYKITPEQAEELQTWAGKMVAQAEQRDWEAPVGYTAQTWPPFEIQTVQPM